MRLSRKNRKTQSPFAFRLLVFLTSFLLGVSSAHATKMTSTQNWDHWIESVAVPGTENGRSIRVCKPSSEATDSKVQCQNYPDFADFKDYGFNGTKGDWEDFFKHCLTYNEMNLLYSVTMVIATYRLAGVFGGMKKLYDSQRTWGQFFKQSLVTSAVSTPMTLPAINGVYPRVDAQGVKAANKHLTVLFAANEGELFFEPALIEALEGLFKTCSFDTKEYLEARRRNDLRASTGFYGGSSSRANPEIEERDFNRAGVRGERITSQSIEDYLSEAATQ